MSYDVLGDWGTTRLRLFRREAGAVTGACEGPGIAALDRPAGELLRALLDPWWREERPHAIRLCGMIGSRNGWIDVPYADCPADAADWAAAAARLSLGAVPVMLMTGLAGRNPHGAPDVMRGEETQIFGALAFDPALREGRVRVVLPGTHSKWAAVDGGRVRGFQTFLTGETFALLRDHSTLARVPVSAEGAQAPGDGFAEGLARARAGAVLGALFEARSRQLRDGRSREWALAFLSGLLIGSEVGEALAGRIGERILLVGDPALCERYARAFAGYGVAADQLDGDACAFAGLALAEEFR